jgi:hypothetical protein
VAATVSIGVGKTATVRHPWAVSGLTFATAAIAFASGFFLIVAIGDFGGEAVGLAAFLIIGWSMSAIVLIGIYGLFWLHFVLTELRDFGIARSDERLSRIRPGLNVVVMIVVGGSVIVAIVILGMLARRIMHAQELAGVERSSFPLLIALLVGGLIFYLPLFAFYGVSQDALNRVWRSLAATAARPEIAGTVAP